MNGDWRLALLAAVAVALPAQGAPQTGAATSPQAAMSAPDVRPGRVLLQARQFGTAKAFFASSLREHPGNPQLELGLGDAELGLHEYALAEASYRAAVEREPELWQAHKNLVIAEAALGRWEEFDGERTVLRLARERGAPGISPRESDVIDTFDVRAQHWVVRSYFEPLGRARTVYNFERFGPTGRVEAYISLEDAALAEQALKPSDLRIGTPAVAAPDTSGKPPLLALNWYTGTAHGTIARYEHGEPPYEQVRAAVLAFVRTHPLVAPLRGR